MVPEEDADFSVRELLIGHFADNIWRQVYQALDANKDGTLSAEELAALDTDGDHRYVRVRRAV